MFADASPQAAFDYIYQTNKWGDPDSYSGSGSNLAQTQAIRAELPALLERHGIRSLLDAPCGDFFWMRHVELPVDRYIGGDIVKALVESNNAEHGQPPQRTFIHLDLTSDTLPEVDALLCRDCMVHLDVPRNAELIENVRSSDLTYLLATSHQAVETNVEKEIGRHRLINLAKAPYHWPEPIDAITEDIEGGKDTGKVLGLWRVADLPACAVGA